MSPGNQADARLRVCHIASGDLWAGAEVQIATLIAATVPSCDVTLIVLNEGRLAQEALRVGAAVVVVPEGNLTFRQIVERTSQTLMNADYDVLHSHRYKENIIATWMKRRHRIPVFVRTQHGMPELGSNVGFKHRFLQHVDFASVRFGTDAVIAVSEELAGWLREKAPPGKVNYIANGIDLQRTTASLDRTAAKRMLGVAPDTPLFGIVGRLEQVKRVDRFIRAISLLKDRIPNAQGIVVGDGPLRQELESLTRGLKAPVRFLGHVDNVFETIRALDALVMSSDHEGLPMVLLEAMALRTLVVGRNVGGIPEVLDQGRAGILFSGEAESLAETLQAMFSIPANDRLVMEHHAANRVAERYSAQKNAAAVIALYKKFLVGQK